MHQNWTDNAREWLANGMDLETMNQKLIEAGMAAEDAEAICQLVKKEKRARNRNTGMILLGIGSALCLLSMVYTFVYGHNYFMLYGLTMIGVSVAFAGLVYIMG